MRLEDAKPKTLPNGVVVPPSLQVDELTLRQHRDRLGALGVRMTPDMARSCGYTDPEVQDVFGPETARPDPDPTTGASHGRL